MAIGKFLKGIAKDIKKGAKGSKEYQEGKAKREKSGKWYPGKYAKKAVKQVAKDIKKGAKGSKEYQAGKAKKKAGKTWTKAVKAQKKAGTGETLSSLVKARDAAKASGNKTAYAAAQNKINKAYGSKVRHKAPKAPAKPKAKADTTKKVGREPRQTKRQQREERISGNEKAAPLGKKQVKAKITPIQPTPPPADTTMEGGEFGKYNPEKMAEGGKVEGNPYGWPSRDARNGGKK